MSTGEFFKNHDEELDNMHCSTRSLNMAMRKNDHVLGVANDGTKKAYEKAPLINFPACHHAISISRISDVKSDALCATCGTRKGGNPKVCF